MGTVGGIYLFVTQYLQLVRGLTPLAAGLWLLPPAGALILASMLTPILARKREPRFIVAAALAVATVGYLTLAFVEAVSGVPVLVSGFVLVHVGISPLMVLGTDLVIGVTPPAQAGSAAAMSETSMEFGIAIGIAVLGVLGAAAYRADVVDASLPGVPAQARQAAKDSLGTADAAAADLPAPLGERCSAPLARRSRTASTPPLSPARRSRPCSPSWRRPRCDRPRSRPRRIGARPRPATAWSGEGYGVRHPRGRERLFVVGGSS
ncbi:MULTISPECIES: hypothetical protein [Nocardia]|uniref:hypothetical protein n=1 Tax=Nocardia TaxID=1817 RepID=UPI0035585CD9